MTSRIIGKAVLADTGVLYALVDSKDQHNERAQLESRLLVQAHRRVIVTYPTLQEAYTLVLHRLKPHVAVRWLREVRSGTDLLSVPGGDFQTAMALTERYRDQTLTLHDLVLSVVSNNLNLPIWTFDADFDILGAQVWRDS